MTMANEVELPRPLDGEEVKVAIAHKIAESVMAALDKQCSLFGKAYPKFKAEFEIHFTLDNFGLVREGTSRGSIVAEGEIVEPVAIEIEGEIPETPPNQLRRETGQSIPLQVTDEKGIQSEKAVFYKPKGKPGPKPKPREPLG